MQYDVLLIAQTTNMGCWAASIAMILSWKNSASFDPGLIAANPGGVSYVPSLTNGLDPNDRYILERNGFAVEPPQCYLPSAIRGLLSDAGPLWVATWAPGPHIRVVTGMENANLSVNDPWPVNKGARYQRPFNTFFGRMENLGARELNEPNPVYVAYLKS